MSYTWTDGEVITAEKLNSMADGDCVIIPCHITEHVSERKKGILSFDSFSDTVLDALDDPYKRVKFLLIDDTEEANPPMLTEEVFSFNTKLYANTINGYVKIDGSSDTTGVYYYNFTHVANPDKDLVIKVETTEDLVHRYDRDSIFSTIAHGRLVTFIVMQNSEDASYYHPIQAADSIKLSRYCGTIGADTYYVLSDKLSTSETDEGGTK